MHISIALNFLLFKSPRGEEGGGRWAIIKPPVFPSGDVPTSQEMLESTCT